MKNKRTKFITVMAVVCLMYFARSSDAVFTDREIRSKIVRYISPVCAESLPSVPLVDTYYIKGDTNRLLRLLSELIQTNDEWYCSRSMTQYGKYAGESELPFLYSCVTNPLCGHCALKSIFRIEGVSTNSLLVLGQYLSLPNKGVGRLHLERYYLCRFLIDDFFWNEKYSQYRSSLKRLLFDFAQGENTKHVNMDRLLIRIDNQYEFSKRRLALMRDIWTRGINEMQTNYVEGVIKELEKYPEENLAD